MKGKMWKEKRKEKWNPKTGIPAFKSKIAEYVCKLRIGSLSRMTWSSNLKLDFIHPY